MNSVQLLRIYKFRCAYHIIRQCIQTKTKFAQVSHKYNTIGNKLNVFAALALLWPTKKNIENVEKVDSMQEVIENADNLFQNGHYYQCYTLLSSYKDAQDVEIKWRISRALYNISKDITKSVAERKDAIFQAYDIIEDALKENDNHYAVHKWYALLLDAKSGYNGIKARINQLENVKKHMAQAVQLNPNDATTLYMLGEWCYQTTDMPWYQRKIANTLFASPPTSSYEEALDYFLKAESVEPRFYSLNLLMLGKTYLKLKKDDQAKYYLKLAASYPAKSNDDHRANKEAADLLKKLK